MVRHFNSSACWNTMPMSRAGIERRARVADLDGAAVGLMQPGQDLQHRGLAAAGGADQRDQFAFLHVHGDVGDREEFRAPRTIDLADIAQADEGLVRPSCQPFLQDWRRRKSSSLRSACSLQTRSISCIWPGLRPSVGSRHQIPSISPCRRRISWQPAMQPWKLLATSKNALLQSVTRASSASRSAGTRLLVARGAGTSRTV